MIPVVTTFVFRLHILAGMDFADVGVSSEVTFSKKFQLCDN